MYFLSDGGQGTRRMQKDIFFKYFALVPWAPNGNSFGNGYAGQDYA